VVGLKEKIKEQEKKIKDQEKRIAELEEENRELRERLDTREPIQEKMESGKPNMDKLREIVAGKFLSEPKEEKQQFMKGGDKREWN
jgi:predicted RNase H-like nuclease (RuvC/YqgF family)